MPGELSCCAKVVYKYAVVEESGEVEVEEGEPRRTRLPAGLEDGEVVALCDVWQVSCGLRWLEPLGLLSTCGRALLSVLLECRGVTGSLRARRGCAAGYLAASRPAGHQRLHARHPGQQNARGGLRAAAPGA